MSALTEIYYKPEHLWFGKKAIKKLQDESELPRKQVVKFLVKQGFWQVHLPRPRKIKKPHYQVTVPNEVHEFDLLFMPADVLYGNKYKYILTGVDVASRYKVARPLLTKNASEVAERLKDIYKAGPLTWPKTVQIDNGSEFKADVTKLYEKQGVKIRRATTKYKHTHTAFPGTMNKELAEFSFKLQDAQELNDPEKVFGTWIKYLYKIIKKMNNTVTAMIGMKPKDAIKLDRVKQVKSEEYPKEDTLPLDGLYRYLYQPGEQHGDQRRRATDLNWSKETYRLDRVIEDPGNRVLYYLAKPAPERAFVSEELMLIPEDTEVPPDWVKEW